MKIPDDKSAGILKRTLSSVTQSYKPKHTKTVVSKKKPLTTVPEFGSDDPPPITEEDIDKGMITLLNRGIIPKDVDLTPAFEKGAPSVTVKGAKFHDQTSRHVKRDV